MSLSGCQINPIHVNFHLQKSLEFFSNRSTNKVWSKKDRGWKVPCPSQLGLINYLVFELLQGRRWFWRRSGWIRGWPRGWGWPWRPYAQPATLWKSWGSWGLLTWPLPPTPSPILYAWAHGRLRKWNLLTNFKYVFCIFSLHICIKVMKYLEAIVGNWLEKKDISYNHKHTDN